MNAIERQPQLPEMFDLVVTVRDLATSLTGDPMQGDAIMRRALRDLRKDDPKRQVRGEEAREWLTACIVGLCLEHSGCLRCADDEYEDRSDDSDSEDDNDVEESELRGETEPESGDETIFGDEAA
jgi:hypothetical protein